MVFLWRANCLLSRQSKKSCRRVGKITFSMRFDFAAFHDWRNSIQSKKEKLFPKKNFLWKPKSDTFELFFCRQVSLPNLRSSTWLITFCYHYLTWWCFCVYLLRVLSGEISSHENISQISKSWHSVASVPMNIKIVHWSLVFQLFWHSGVINFAFIRTQSGKLLRIS